MQVSRRTAITALAVAALGGSATTAVSALGHDRGREHRGNDRGRHHGKLLETSLAPAVPAPAVPAAAGGPTLNGIAPGGFPWVLKRGAATLERSGELRVFVRGLVIPPPTGTNTPGPVSTVSASLYCDGSSSPVGSTPQVPLSSAGDATMTATVAVPPKCLAPLVLVHPNGNGGAYIAASGFGG